MKISKIAAFSLLAHINDNNIGIKSFHDIFIPIVKSALCKLNHDGVKSGASVAEIKTKVDELFSLDIPIPLLRDLLLTISNEVEKNTDNHFILHKDGAFQMNKFLFADYEEEIEQNEEEINEVERVYRAYLTSNNLDYKNEPSIFEYIDQNRLNLSKFFAYKKDKEIEIEFVHQANFINSIKFNSKIYSILRKVYLGSLIAAYLEVEIGEAKNKVDLLLDTNFILGLLDLNSEEATHTCRKIIEIADRLGYTKSILPFTIEEIELLIERKANQLENAFFQGYLDPESIYNAAKRRNLSKTQLQQISNKLRTTLEDEFQINIINNDQKFRNLAKFQYAKIYEFYKTLRGTQGFSALHDTTAIVYVKEKRGGMPVKGDLMKVNCWFVTNTPLGIPLPENNGFLPEIIRAEELLNFLWLSNPNVTALISGSEISSLGLTRLVSTTISNSLPSSKVLRQLDENFNTYGGSEISADDTVMVAAMISKKRIAKPDELNKIALNNPDNFISKVKEYVKEGRQEEKEIKEKLNKIFEVIDSSAKRVAEENKLSQSENTSLINDKESLEKTKKRLLFIILMLVLLFVSFFWWAFDHLFSVPFILENPNYYFIKFLGQGFLITVSLAILHKNYRGSWITGTNALLIATCMLSKFETKGKTTNKANQEKTK